MKKFISKVVSIIKGQPAVIVSFIGAAIGLAVASGFNLTVTQVAEIMAFVTTGLGFITQMLVSPASTVVAQMVDGQVVAGLAHPEKPVGAVVNLPI